MLGAGVTALAVGVVCALGFVVWLAGGRSFPQK
jgi:hypothetical protein